MRWVLRLIATGDDARCLSTDLVEICRPGGLGDIANLGLTLAGAKQLLVSVQRAVVAGQVGSHGQLRPCCRSCGAKCHLKDWRGHCIATLFGEVTVQLPRFLCPACHRSETGVCWPSRCRSTPELDQLQAHLSALMSYRVAAGVLQHLLPIDAGRSPETLRHHTLQIGAQLGTTTSSQPTTAAAEALTVSVDSTFIRSREEGDRRLEVRVGNIETASRGRQVFGAVAKADTDLSALIRRNLRAVGLTDNSKGDRVHRRRSRSSIHPGRCWDHHATHPGLVSHCDANAARGTDSKRFTHRQSRQDAGEVRDRRGGRTSALAHLERQGQECQAQHRSGPQSHARLQGRPRTSHEKRAVSQAIAYIA